jgi:hypothetical protein
VTGEGPQRNIRIDEKRINIKDAGHPLPDQPALPNGVNISSTPTEGKIEYLEKNDTPGKAAPGRNQSHN